MEKDSEALVEQIKKMLCNNNEERNITNTAICNAMKTNSLQFLQTSFKCLVQDSLIDSNYIKVLSVLITKCTSWMVKDDYELKSEDESNLLEEIRINQILKVQNMNDRMVVNQLLEASVNLSLFFLRNNIGTNGSYMKTLEDLLIKNKLLALAYLDASSHTLIYLHLDKQSRNGILKVIGETLFSDSYEIVITGLKIITQIFDKEEFVSHAEFADLAPYAVNLIDKIFNKDPNIDSGKILEQIRLLNQITSTGSKMFSNNWEILVEILYQRWFAIINNLTRSANNPEIEVIEECQLDICETIPGKVIENSDRLQKIIEVISLGTAPEYADVSQEWLNPGPSTEEVDPALQLKISKVDRLLSAFESDYVIKLLSKRVEIYLASDDWRYRVAGQFSQSQVGEYVKDIELVKPLISVLVQLVINDPHSKIRYACYHCLGQLAQDLSPEFQTRFGDDVLYVLINGLQDEIPRVKSHALCALTNFNEGTVVEVISDKADIMTSRILDIIKNNNSTVFVKKGAVTCLTSVMRGLKHECQKYYPELIPYLLATFRKEHQQSEELNSRIIDCITMMTYFTEDDIVDKYFNDIFSLLKYFQCSIISYTDPRIDYLLTAWNRLVFKMKENSRPYINDIFAIISKVLEQLTHYKKYIDEKRTNKNFQEDDHDGDINKIINKSDYELSTAQITSSIKILIIMHSQFTKEFVNRSENLIEILIIALTLVADNELKKISSKAIVAQFKGCIANYKDIASPANSSSNYVEEGFGSSTSTPKNLMNLNANKNLSRPDPKQMIKVTITMLFSILKNEGDSEYRSFYVKTIKELIGLISNTKVYNSAELQNLFKEMLHLLSGSFTIINDLQVRLTNFDDAENHELSFVENLISTEEINLNMYGAIYHSIFSTYNESSFGLAKFLFENVAERIGDNNEVHTIISSVCLSIITTLVELFPELIIKMRSVDYFYKVFKKYATCIPVNLRKVGCYGIGLLPGIALQNFECYYEDAINTIQTAGYIEKPTTTHYSENLICKEYITAAFGKVIYIALKYNFGEPYSRFEHWNNFQNSLPLKKALNEGYIMQHNLQDIISNYNVYFGNDLVFLPPAMKVIGEVYETRLSNSNLDQKICILLKSFRSKEDYKSCTIEGVEPLRDEKKFKIITIISESVHQGSRMSNINLP